MLRKRTSLVIMLTAWWIWKHHNTAILDNAQPSVVSLLDTIKAEARLWAQAGIRVFANCSHRILWVELYGVVLAQYCTCIKTFFLSMHQNAMFLVFP
jgi:hypothetical protein